MDAAKMDKKIARDLERIIEIRSHMDAWVDAHVASKDLMRILRKDFHCVSRYIFFARDQKKAALIIALRNLETLILHIRMDMEMLELPSPLPISPERQTINLRLVSTMTAKYFRCLVDVDHILIQLSNAEYLKLIGSDQRKTHIKDMFRMVGEVKRIALDIVLQPRNGGFRG